MKKHKYGLWLTAHMAMSFLFGVYLGINKIFVDDFQYWIGVLLFFAGMEVYRQTEMAREQKRQEKILDELRNKFYRPTRSSMYTNS